MSALPLWTYRRRCSPGCACERSPAPPGGTGAAGRFALNPLLLQLHVEPEPADLVGEHVEAGGRAGLQRVLALDHGLVDLGAALDVVGLDGEQLLQDVG